MFYWSLIIILIGIYSSYIFGKSRIKKNSIAANIKSVSLPTYYAQYMLFWCLLPALIVYFGWIIFEDQIIQNLIQKEVQVGNVPDLECDCNLDIIND